MEILLISIIAIVVFALIFLTVERSEETGLEEQEGIEVEETKDLKINIIPMPGVVSSRVRVIIQDKNNKPLPGIKVVENSTGSSGETDSYGVVNLIMPAPIVTGVGPTTSTISVYYGDKVITVSYETGYREE